MSNDGWGDGILVEFKLLWNTTISDKSNGRALPPRSRHRNVRKAAAMSSAEDPVAFAVEDGIAWVRFNRPDKRNSMSPALNRRMMQVLEELEFRDDVGVLVLSGEGSAWSAGMDLKEYFRESEAGGLGAVRRSQAEAYGWWRKLRWYQKPTIAMVNGWCFGGGYGPLFACDLAFAADEARFALSEINWGILPGGGATKVVVDLLSRRDAMYHALTGELIDGRKAAEWRLVNESLPLAALRARVAEVAGVLLTKNPVALKATKDAIRRVAEMTYDNAEDYLVRAQEAANFHDSSGRKEGIRQFIDEKSYKPGLGAYDKGRATP
jgi:trans-feruloyl-CoA hydratase/vanillin synthase